MPRAPGVAAAIHRRAFLAGHVVSVRYIALLRGINVGGKTLIKMADLSAYIEALRLDDVSTYIASGNVLFYSTERDAAKLETTIERAIEQRFQLPVRVIVLDRAAYGRIVKAIPKSWVGNASLRANVPEQEKEEVLAAFAAHKAEVTEGYSD
jgi:uncharacterized protein (DUF1697 family)